MATLNTFSLPVGTDTLAAIFPGDPYLAATTSNPLVQAVHLVVSTTGTVLTATGSDSAVTTVASGSVVTLTATVASGETAETLGQVRFCDALVNTRCTDSALLGTAQLTSDGTARIKLRLGIGSHSLQAIFAGTVTCTSSSSSKQALTVTGKYATTSYLSASPGTAGSWNFMAKVEGPPLGFLTSGPSGTVAFLDTSDANQQLASASLSAGSSSYLQNFQLVNTPSITGAPFSVTVGDFNSDGKLDLVSADSNNTVSILLGNGDGTYQTQQTYVTGADPFSVTVGDFNGDGKLDLAVANYKRQHCFGAVGQRRWHLPDATDLRHRL